MPNRAALLLLTSLVIGCRQAPPPFHKPSALAASDGAPGRPVYPYSIVPGGVDEPRDLERAAQEDEVVRAHYEGVAPRELRRTTLTGDLDAHVSYRIAQRVYWTRRKVHLKRGEIVLAGIHGMVRGRCGNRIAEETKGPFAPPELEPAEGEMDMPQPLQSLASLPPTEEIVLPGRPPQQLRRPMEPAAKIQTTLPAVGSAGWNTVPRSGLLPAVIVVGTAGGIGGGIPGGTTSPTGGVPPATSTTLPTLPPREVIPTIWYPQANRPGTPAPPPLVIAIPELTRWELPLNPMAPTAYPPPPQRWSPPPPPEIPTGLPPAGLLAPLAVEEPPPTGNPPATPLGLDDPPPAPPLNHPQESIVPEPDSLVYSLLGLGALMLTSFARKRRS